MGVSPEKPQRKRIDCENSSSSTSKREESFWSGKIALNFFGDQGTLSDHLANERTYHNWLALSNAVSWMGLVVAQMSKISKVVRPGHYHMLRYKACICQGLAVVILVIGTYRFFKEQGAINGTGSRASHLSLLGAGLLILLLATSFFIMLIIADTDIIE